MWAFQNTTSNVSKVQNIFYEDIFVVNNQLSIFLFKVSAEITMMLKTMIWKNCRLLNMLKSSKLEMTLCKLIGKNVLNISIAPKILCNLL